MEEHLFSFVIHRELENGITEPVDESRYMLIIVGAWSDLDTVTTREAGRQKRTSRNLAPEKRASMFAPGPGDDVFNGSRVPLQQIEKMCAGLIG